MKNRLQHTLGAALCAAVTSVGLGGAGCSAAPPPKPAEHAGPTATAPRANEDAAVQAEDREQREAQRAWCQYLEALYLRATDTQGRWSRFDECARATSTASPAMLRRTADCSMKALGEFEGDPLTPAYAAQVRVCGARALDTTIASDLEVEPLVSAICERARACGEAKDDARCRAILLSEQSPRIGRAMGAISLRGREALRACVVAAPCGDLNDVVAKCLEPILDRLLWLPE